MSSAEQILDIAERKMRRAGYNAVSYRDIAADMGIKSASIHYHFPKKEDLGCELVRRYAENFSMAAEDQLRGLTDPQARLIAYVDVYRQALNQEDLVCLCAVLGAEAPGLPEKVSREVQTFFELNIKWLTNAYSNLDCANPEQKAKAALATLEGAMIISVVNKDKTIFEAAAQSVLQ